MSSCGCGCCGNGSANDGSTIITGTCCGLPEPEDGWANAVDVRLVLRTSDATTGLKMNIHSLGTGNAVADPTGAQRLYLFSIKVVVDVAGTLEIYESITDTPPGEWSYIVSSPLAKNAGIVSKEPNTPLRQGNTLYVRHSAVGTVHAVVQGKLVNVP